MSSKTSARRPVGWSYKTSSSVMICAWGDKRRNAWISRRLFTCEDNEPWRLKEARLVNRIKMVFHAFDSMVLAILDILGFQNLAKVQLHAHAERTPEQTSLNVPSPFFATSLYL